MLEQSSLEAPVRDPRQESLELWHGEPPWEPVRVTREARAEQALVAVVGLSYAGLPSAIALRHAGFRIVGIDTSSSRLDDIRNGRTELLVAEREDLLGQLHDEDFVLTDRIDAVHTADAVLIVRAGHARPSAAPELADAAGARALPSSRTRTPARRSC